MSQSPAFPYDPACPVRDPRTKAYGVPPEDVVLDMASVLCLKVRASHDGRAYEKDLVDAGFSHAEIDRHGPAARLAAAERLKPRQIDEERIEAMADALAGARGSGDDRVNIATLAAAGFPMDAILSDLDAATTRLADRRRAALASEAA